MLKRFNIQLFTTLPCSTLLVLASSGHSFEHVLFLVFAGFLNVADTHFFLQIIMLPTKHKHSDEERAGQTAKRGLEVVEDMFMQETFQYEAELKAEGLPSNLSPLEAAMALAKWEEAKPLHKLSPVSIYNLFDLILKTYTYF